MKPLRPGIKTRTFFLYAFCLVCFAVLLTSALNASVSQKIPAGTVKAPVRLSNPGKLAVDNQLIVYAVDGYKNRVQMFNSFGQNQQTIKIERPSALAVGPDNTLYVGSHHDYSVAMYRDGEVKGHLGNGPNEFSSIMDIFVDQRLGDIYIADAANNSVRIYMASGVSKGSFSGFNAPVSVAVTDDDVYILDAPVTGMPGKPGTGSRISVFSKSGSFRWSIDERSDGQMIRPVDMAVDRMGNIFVADAGRNAVLIYDRRGAYTGRIAATDGAVDTPVSLALTRDDRLYVSSAKTDGIVEIGLGGSIISHGDISLDLRSGTGEAVSFTVLGY